MRQVRYRIAALSILLVLAACRSAPTAAPTATTARPPPSPTRAPLPTPTATPTPACQECITISGMRIQPGQFVVVGDSTLPDGTCLRTQLFVEGLPLDWWPQETCVQVQDGAWRISVSLQEGGALYERPPGGVYTLVAWQEGRRVASAVFGVDYGGPPTPTPTPPAVAPATPVLPLVGYLDHAADSLAYVNVHDGYCLRYPRGFEVDENRASDTLYAVLQDPHAGNRTQADENPAPDVVFVVGPNRSTGADPLRARLSIRVEAYTRARAMAEVADEYVKGNLRASAPPGAVFTQTMTTLGGAPAVWVEGPGRAEGESEYTMVRRLLARYESRLFILRFYPDPAAFPALAEDVEALYHAVAASFMFLPERFPEREPPYAQTQVNAPPGWPPEVPAFTLDLETWHGPGFSFLYPAGAQVKEEALSRRRAWQLASPATSQIRVLGPLVWVKPGDANWSRTGSAYTLRVRTYENSQMLDAEAWARAYLLDSWREAVEQDRPQGGLPVSENGEIQEESVGPAQVAGQPAFRVRYYSFDSARLAYYVAGDGQIVELSLQLYPLANEPLMLVQRDVYALILSTFRLEGS